MTAKTQLVHSLQLKVYVCKHIILALNAGETFSCINAFLLMENVAAMSKCADMGPFFELNCVWSNFISEIFLEISWEYQNMSCFTGHCFSSTDYVVRYGSPDVRRAYLKCL